MSHSKFPPGDPQLPVLEDFQVAPTEPSPPEPWWTRYFSYIFFCCAATAIASGVAFFELSGAGSRGTRSLAKTYYLRDAAAYNRIVIRGTVIVGSAALLASLALCGWEEAKFNKRRVTVAPSR